MARQVYLDNNATTPVDPIVFEAMRPYFCEKFGNAASRNHSFGWEAQEAVETARKHVAELIDAGPKDIIFTSGATEGNNIAIIGVAKANAERGRHVITQATEHKAVLDVVEHLRHTGFRVTVLPVDEYGRIDLDQLSDTINDDTILVSIMHGNNEIGTVQPIAPIGRLCKDRGVMFHTDASQTFGKLPIDVEKTGVDLLTCSGHKMHGPKGVGALFVRRRGPRVRCQPLVHGGGHERGLRSGTLNVPAIVGFGAAAEICRKGMKAESARLAGLRDQLKEAILTELDDVHLNGHPVKRTPTNLNLTLTGVEAEALVLRLKDVAISTGSACTTASLHPSHVLVALGFNDVRIAGSIRMSLGRFTSKDDIEYAAARLAIEVRELRKMPSFPVR